MYKRLLLKNGEIRGTVGFEVYNDKRGNFHIYSVFV